MTGGSNIMSDLCEYDGMSGKLAMDTYNFLQRPQLAYEKLKQACDRYDEYRTRVCGSAIRYENPLGVKVQSTVRNNFEDSMVKLHEFDEMRRTAYLLYQCERITVCNAICRASLTTDQKHVLMERYRGKQPTYREIAKKYNLRNADSARYLDRTGTNAFAYDYIANM